MNDTADCPPEEPSFDADGRPDAQPSTLRRDRAPGEPYDPWVHWQRDAPPGWWRSPSAREQLVVPPGHYLIWQLDGSHRVTANPPTIWGPVDRAGPDEAPDWELDPATGEPLLVVEEDNFEPDAPSFESDDQHPGLTEDLLERGRREGIRAWTLAEARRVPVPRWLVPGLAVEGELLLMYGRPKEGKTFVALDMSLCVATGRSFHGRAAGRPRRVAYVIAEGNLAQFMGRVDAWLGAHGLDDAPNLALVPQRVAVNRPPRVEELLRAIGRPDLVVMDTLARTLDGDENTPADTGAYVAGCDEIRERTGAAVHVVHHEGKSAGKGPMGHTRLFGSVDTLLHVEQDARTRAVTLRVEARRTGRTATG